MAEKKQLRKIPPSELRTFKIKNRKGFAAICKNNLTEGSTVREATARMDKALKRIGFTL